MTQKELDHIRKLERWKDLIAEQKTSGKSIKTFCNEKGVSASAYQYWKNVAVRTVLDEANAIGVLKAPSPIQEAQAVVEVAENVAFASEGPKEGSDTESNEIPLSDNPAYIAHMRSLKEKAVNCAFAYDERGKTGFNQGSFTIYGLKCAIKSTQVNASRIMHWMEDKGIITKSNGQHRGNRDVLLTRDQWNVFKDQLLDTDATVLELLARLPQPKNTPEPAAAEQPATSEFPELNTILNDTGDNTYLEKLEAVPPQPVSENKTSAGAIPGTGFGSLVVDYAQSRVYVSGDADEKTVKTAAQLIKELEDQRSQRQRCTPHAQRPTPPAPTGEREAPSADSLPS